MELPVCRQLHVIHHEPTPPHYAVHATSHALADDLTCPKVDPVDDDDDSVVNADGLNVLSDPLAPPPRGGRRPPPSTAQLATNASQPIVYPLSSSRNLQPCYTCGPELQPYCISATDIPTNGSLSPSYFSSGCLLYCDAIATRSPRDFHATPLRSRVRLGLGVF